MLKYVETSIVFQEIPDEVTLSVNLSNCPCRCPGCHSQYLWEDSGQPLTPHSIETLLKKYAPYITCMCFMGGDAEPAAVNMLARHLYHSHPELKVAWYSGRTRLPVVICKTYFDYIKVGPYIKHLGGLKKPTTNQRIYKKGPDGIFVDITPRFWRMDTEAKRIY